MAYHYIIPKNDCDPQAMWEMIEKILPKNIYCWSKISSQNTDTKIYYLKGANGIAIATLSKNGPLALEPINYSGATVITKDEEKITDAYTIPLNVSGCGQIYVNMFNYEIFKDLNAEFKKLVKTI